MASYWLVLAIVLLNCFESNKSTQIYCTEPEQCKNSLLQCEPYQTCYVVCSSDQSCENAEIQCPIDAECNIYCVASSCNQNVSHSICKHSFINASLSTHLYIETSPNHDIFRSSSVFCPFHGKCSFFGGDNSMIETDIHARGGFNNVDILCNDCHFGYMHCTDDFSQNCQISQNDPYSCSDPNSVCNRQYPNSDSTSHFPTVFPTEHPTTGSGAASSEMQLVTTGVVCDFSCKYEVNVIHTNFQISISLTDQVVYNAMGLECYLFLIFSEYLIGTNAGTKDVNACNVNVMHIDGGTLDDALTCASVYTPCFALIGDSARRRSLLLENGMDRMMIAIITSSSTIESAIVLSDLYDAITYRLSVDFDLVSFLVVLSVSGPNNDDGLVYDGSDGSDDFPQNTTAHSLIGNDELNVGNSFTERAESDGMSGHFEGSQSQLICVSVYLLILYILFPFEVYWTLSLFRNRMEPFVHARRPVLNVYINLFAMFFLVIERTMHAIHKVSIYNELWFEWMRLCVFYVSVMILTVFIVLRYWLLLFDISWANSFSKSEWTKLVDTSLSCDGISNNFWMKYHGTLGMFTFCWKVALVIGVSLGVIPIVLTHCFGYSIGSIAMGVVIGFFVFLLYVLWRNTPLFHDEFRILEECSLILAWLALAVIADIVFSILEMALGSHFYLWFLSFSVPFILIIGVIFIQSNWVLLFMRRSRVSISDFGRQSTSEVIMQLDELLADRIGCETFITHLLKEFSVENVLAVIEMTQFKQFYVKWYNYQFKHGYITSDDDRDDRDEDVDEDDDDVTDALLADIDENDVKVDLEKEYSEIFQRKALDIESQGSYIVALPKRFPKSTIVWKMHYKNMSLDSIKNSIVSELFAKYCKVGTEMELNISSKMRRDICKEFDKLDQIDDIELYSFFDNVIQAMLKLMRDSYTRFRETKGFAKYEMSYFTHRNKSSVSSIPRISSRILRRNKS